jgi:membrane associated rhomboid family serine protease
MRPIVLIVLALNVVVFVLWQYLGVSPYMVDNFLISWDALQAGRYWTLLTSAFSHVAFLHFFLNMYVLTTFGTIVEYMIGSWRFIVLYLTAAIVASVSHAAVSALMLDKPEQPALGASGAISGVVLVFCLLFPRARLLLFGFIPMPAIFGALLFVGIDLLGLYFQTAGGGLPIGHGAHLGGAATGLLFYLVAVHGMGVGRTGPEDFGDVATWRGKIAQSRPPNWDGP